MGHLLSWICAILYILFAWRTLSQNLKDSCASVCLLFWKVHFPVSLTTATGPPSPLFPHLSDQFYGSHSANNTKNVVSFLQPPDSENTRRGLWQIIEAGGCDLQEAFYKPFLTFSLQGWLNCVRNQNTSISKYNKLLSVEWSHVSKTNCGWPCHILSSERWIKQIIIFEPEQTSLLCSWKEREKTINVSLAQRCWWWCLRLSRDLGINSCI